MKFKIDVRYTETQTVCSRGYKTLHVEAKSMAEAERIVRDNDGNNANDLIEEIDTSERDCDVLDSEGVEYHEIDTIDPVNSGFSVVNPITTMKQVRGFFRHLLTDIRLNFHPDDSMRDYEQSPGVPTFPHSADFYQNRMNECFVVCEQNNRCIYLTGLRMMEAAIRMGITPTASNKTLLSVMETNGPKA